jgi:beta-N-acetylhexosaminidase
VARANAALTAGCDMVLVCNRPDLTADLLRRWQPEVSARSAQRILALTPAARPHPEVLSVDPRFQQAWQTVTQLA